MISNSFKMENCPFQFTFHQIFVIKGLNQNVNISLPFLQKYKFIIDLDQNHFQFNHNDQKFNISFVLRNSTRISMTEMTADFPKSGISGPPGQKIHVQTIYGIVEQIFTPRPPRIGNKPKQTDLDLKPTGPDINFVPWRVLSNSNDPRGSLRVKDLSEKRRTLHDQFKLGHLCNIAPPLATPKVDTATCKERRSIIQAQVKINEEFQNEYLEDLYDLILEFAEVISWNDEPGRTTLGETFH